MSRAAPTVVAPDPRVHGEVICDLAGKCFSAGGYYKFRDFSRSGYILGGHYDWAASRIGLVDGRVVSHWGVWDYRMRIGTARVRTGGIGAVMTDADWRRRGLMACTGRAALAAMRELGYDLSVLFGKDDFYWRFGYVRAWSDTTWTAALADLPPGRPTARLRKFKPVHREDVARLYNRENAGVTGTAVRPTYRCLLYPREMEGYLWQDARGRLSGYVVVERKGALLDCTEACGNADEVLRVLAMIARQGGANEVQFFSFPEASLIIGRLRRGNCRSETRWRRSGGPMVATLNLTSTLVRMSGELGRRLRASHLADWRGRLLVADRRDKVLLAIDRSRVTAKPGAASPHALRGGDAIAQLLIGTGDPDETIETGPIRVAGDARLLARVLFPSQHPQLSLRDRF